jgi:LysR family glycine cleavage system transcriptional activator
LNWLRSFEAAARRLSFTAAGEELHVTQSAVSQQVRNLESMLGQPLFLRGPRSLQLTEAGRRYLPTVENAFELLSQGTGEFLAPREDNLLDIRANFAFTLYWLTPRLEDFLARHPGLRINLSAALWQSDFAGTPASVEIRYGRGQWEGVWSERLIADRLAPVSAPALAARLTEPQDLAGETLLHMTSAGDSWDYWGRKAGVPAVRRREGHFLNAIAPMMELAKRGQGVALGYESICRSMLEDGDLAAPFDLWVPAQDNYYVVIANRDQASPAARAFRDWVFEQV